MTMTLADSGKKRIHDPTIKINVYSKIDFQIDFRVSHEVKDPGAKNSYS